MSTNHGPVTMRTLAQLQVIAEAAQSNARVRWLLDSADIQEGTARSIGDERGTFLSFGPSGFAYAAEEAQQ